MAKTVFLFLSVMNFGGQEHFVSRLSEILHKKYEVYVVLFDASDMRYPIYGKVLDIKKGKFDSNSLLARVQKTLIRYFRMRHFIQLYKPKACISFGRGPNILNLLCKQRHIKIYPSIRGYASVERIVKSRIEKLLYYRADKIVCVSKGIEKKIQNSLSSIDKKTTVLYNAYDIERIVKLSCEKLCCLSTYGNPKLISVGTLRPEKGYWHLIKAVFVLRQKYPNVQLLILGENYQNNAENLDKLIKKLDLSENVTLGGWEKNPYPFIKQSDIYVLSSIREGFPNALVEGMICGKPIVSTDCLTGPREILSNNPYNMEATSVEFADYGVLVPRMTLEENYGPEIMSEERILADAIDLLFSDSGLMISYSELSKQRASEFTYERCEKDILKLIEG